MCRAKTSSGAQALQVMLQAPEGAEQWEHVAGVPAGLPYCSLCWAERRTLFAIAEVTPEVHALLRAAVFSYGMSLGLYRI